MYLERKDYRGIVIFLSIVAFCVAFGLADRTIDREAGERVGRRELVAGHTGDLKFWSYAGITASAGAVLAILALVRPLWEPLQKRKDADPDRQRTTRGM
jgi:hypothetical protein